MMRSMQVLLAGFGGQGILFAGKLIAVAGLMEQREVSWLPSYGPEMRGGTANCSVCLSDEAIGSPMVLNPNVLVVMNQPSLDKFDTSIVPGGILVADSTLVQHIPEIPQVTQYSIPATKLAEDHGYRGLANVIMVGKLLAVTSFCGEQTLREAMKECVSSKRMDKLPGNLAALELGMHQ